MSNEEYCTCDSRITQELTRLLKTDYDCEDCDKKLNPDITARAATQGKRTTPTRRYHSEGLEAVLVTKTKSWNKKTDRSGLAIPDRLGRERNRTKRTPATTNFGYRRDQQTPADSDHLTTHQKGIGLTLLRELDRPFSGITWVISTEY